MEDSCCKSSRSICFPENLREMLWSSSTTACNYRDANSIRYELYKIDIKSFPLTITIYAVKEYFTSSQLFDSCCKLISSNWTALSPSIDRALVPSIFFSLGTWICHLHRLELYIIRRLYVYSTRIDAHNNCLISINSGYLFQAALPRFNPSFQVFFSSIHSIASYRNLISPRPEVF
uniref:Uncharacterized protein n=1 Tax=Opuntia streptacantha TaxID=393608 RepID=A0A7C9AIK1_OPUST